MIDISVTNFVTIGAIALIFILIVKFATKKVGINIGLE